MENVLTNVSSPSLGFVHEEFGGGNLNFVKFYLFKYFLDSDRYLEMT